MIRITVDSEKEFKQMERAMDFPSLETLEYHLGYFDPKSVPDGQVIGVGRTRTVQAGGETDDGSRHSG